MTPKGARLEAAAMRAQAHRLMDAARELEAAAYVQEELEAAVERVSAKWGIGPRPKDLGPKTYLTADDEGGTILP